MRTRCVYYRYAFDVSATTKHRHQDCKKAVIYTRVSRDDSGDGASNRRQREDCEKLADLRGWDVVELCEDVSISAYGKKHRPAWKRTLALIESGDVDIVVAWHLDRMTRNMRDLEDLITLSESK